METFDRAFYGVLLFALVLIGCGGNDPKHDEWKTVRQVVSDSCDSLCAWQDRCNDASTPTCPGECVAMICASQDCTATPTGDDAAIDECMTGLASDVSDGACGTAVGLSQDCQDLFLTRD